MRLYKAVRGILHRMAVWAVVFASAAQAQSTLTGRVTTFSDGERRSAPGAWVVASAGSPPRIVASAQTDARGEYRLGGLPEGRVEFTVSQRGFFTLEAGGATSATLARACPGSGSCGEADFVLAKACVVEGYVTDPFGEPQSGVSVELIKTGELPEPNRRGPRGGYRQSMNATDDRGYFRFHGVMPGEYQLETRLPRFFSQVYFADPVDVSVELGQSSAPLFVTLSVKQEPVRVGGVIEGLNLAGGETVRIIAVNAAGGRRPGAISGLLVDAEDEDAPRISGQLEPGEYILTAQVIDESGPGRLVMPGRVVTLGRCRIDADMTDLRLVARAGASFTGRIRFEDMEPQRTDLILVPLDGGTPYTVRMGGNGRFQGPMGRFNGRRFMESPTIERSALLPGRYRIEANSNDFFITSETEFTLSEGQSLVTEVVLSGAFAEIRGVVRPPAEGVGGPFVVALKDSAGKLTSLQTDTAGQYSFPKLVPGDYEICAWADAAVDPQNENAWKAAAAAVKRFPVAAGDQTEILLTAKP